MNEIKNTTKTFENIKHFDENNNEFWYARELMTALEYKKWENFEKVIEKAKTACEQSKNLISNHFPDVRKIVKAGATTKETNDYKLSRYACYLIVQNSDPRKETVALGQTYFAVQTRKQELSGKGFDNMTTEDFDFNLPEELIAQTPLEKRDSSKLLVLDKETGEITHKHFTNIIDYLEKGDTLVLNDTKVIPARLIGTKEETNAVIEVLMLKEIETNTWQCLTKPAKRVYVPEGTKAYMPSHNPQESETIFGRHLNTKIIGVSVENGKIVIHEAFDGYRKR